MSTSLCFNDITLSPVTHQNSLWIRAAELARALGYAREELVSRIYQRNADEFTPDMTQVIENVAEHQNGVQGNLGTGRARIFSLRGCHLIAMFARTPVAKQFRRWVLDVLDKLAEEERAKLSAATKPKREPVRLPATSSNSRKPDKFYCTDTQMRPLDDAINAWAKKAKLRRLEALRRVREHFGFNRFRAWPVELMEPAIAWVEAQTRASLPARQTRPASSLPAVVNEPMPADMPDKFKTALADVDKWTRAWGGTVNWLHIACRPDRDCVAAIEELHAMAVSSAQTVRFALRAMHELGRERRARCPEIADQ